ncbi:hypothetical protein KC669_00565 [Candidatus Dojkabacteria bacterium]|uniref:Uncharacterized protein n=1 Tax=Candidatus Dojkabacteria bacterium TaxID=2099670 RepID=A0A955L9B4_9BACT|nr:hypothetical protein [Candidatus Dojkabacteria bacterium]
MENIKEFILVSSLKGVRAGIMYKIEKSIVYDESTLDTALNDVKNHWLRNEASLRLNPGDANCDEGNDDFVEGLSVIHAEMLEQLNQEES